jgi:hypothetical protein
MVYIPKYIVDELLKEFEIKSDSFLHNMGVGWCKKHNFKIDYGTEYYTKRWFRAVFMETLFDNFDYEKYCSEGLNVKKINTFCSKIASRLLVADVYYRSMSKNPFFKHAIEVIKSHNNEIIKHNKLVDRFRSRIPDGKTDLYMITREGDQYWIEDSENYLSKEINTEVRFYVFTFLMIAMIFSYFLC